MTLSCFDSSENIELMAPGFTTNYMMCPIHFVAFINKCLKVDENIDVSFSKTLGTVLDQLCIITNDAWGCFIEVFFP